MVWCSPAVVEEGPSHRSTFHPIRVRVRVRVRGGPVAQEHVPSYSH